MITIKGIWIEQIDGKWYVVCQGLCAGDGERTMEAVASLEEAERVKEIHSRWFHEGRTISL